MAKKALVLSLVLLINGCFSEDPKQDQSILFNTSEFAQLGCADSQLLDSFGDYTSVDLWFMTMITQNLEAKNCVITINTVIAKTRDQSHSQIMYQQLFSQFNEELASGGMTPVLIDDPPLTVGLESAWYTLNSGNSQLGVLFRCRLPNSAYNITVFNLDPSHYPALGQLIQSKLMSLSSSS